MSLTERRMPSNRGHMLFCFLVNACGHARTPEPHPMMTTSTSATVSGESTASDDIRSPVAVAWTSANLEPSATGAVSPAPVMERRVRLVARIDRSVALGVPMDVTLDLPAGAVLVEGTLHGQIAADAQAGTVEIVHVIAFGATPANDARLIVDAHGPGFGYHAEPRYRFGRPERVVHRAQPTGPNVRAGNLDFGPSIPLLPPTRD